MCFIFFFHSSIFIGHSLCEKAIQTPANKGSGFHTLYMRVLRIAPLLLFSCHFSKVWIYRKERDIWFLLWVLHGKHNSNNFTEGNYLLVSDEGTILDLVNCRVDGFLQVVVSQVLVYISYPAQVHFMKEIEWRIQPWNLKYCGLQSGHLWTSVRGNKLTYQMVFH